MRQTLIKKVFFSSCDALSITLEADRNFSSACRNSFFKSWGWLASVVTLWSVFLCYDWLVSNNCDWYINLHPKFYKDANFPIVEIKRCSIQFARFFLQGFFIFIFHCLFDQQVCDVLWYINLTSFSNLCSVNVFVLITWCSKQIISVGEAAYFWREHVASIMLNRSVGQRKNPEYHFLCPTLVTRWTNISLYFITELNIYHLSH